LYSEVSLDGNVYSIQAASSSLLEPDLSVHCLAELDLGAGVKQPIVLSSRTIMPCNSLRGWWIELWKKTETTVWSSASHSQATGVAIPDMCKSERKRLTLAWRRFSQSHAVFGRDIPEGWIGDEITKSHGALQPFHISLVIRPERRASVIVIRWTDELSGGNKWVSRLELLCIATWWTGERWVEQMSRLHGALC